MLSSELSTPESPEEGAGRSAMTRRRALARLGLASGVAYAAPTIVNLDRHAYAKVTPCPPKGYKGPKPPNCR